MLKVGEDATYLSLYIGIWLVSPKPYELNEEQSATCIIILLMVINHYEYIYTHTHMKIDLCNYLSIYCWVFILIFFGKGV